MGNFIPFRIYEFVLYMLLCSYSVTKIKQQANVYSNNNSHSKNSKKFITRHSRDNVIRHLTNIQHTLHTCLNITLVMFSFSYLKESKATTTIRKYIYKYAVWRKRNQFTRFFYKKKSSRSCIFMLKQWMYFTRKKTRDSFNLFWLHRYVCIYSIQFSGVALSYFNRLTSGFSSFLQNTLFHFFFLTKCASFAL